jgi:hypothetical protein
MLCIVTAVTCRDEHQVYICRPMNRDEIIEYIRSADPFYEKVDFKHHSLEQLQKLMDLLKAVQELSKEKPE